jgi:hypothetical protein
MQWLDCTMQATRQKAGLRSRSRRALLIMACHPLQRRQHGAVLLQHGIRYDTLTTHSSSASELWRVHGRRSGHTYPCGQVQELNPKRKLTAWSNSASMRWIENMTISPTQQPASQDGGTSTYEHAITKPPSLNITCIGSISCDRSNP